jgi:GNAT superfamily N-acetyltransferase
MHELVVRAGRVEDRPAMLALMRRSLREGSIPRHPEYWSWKHDRNPFGASTILVSEIDGRLVGLRVFMRWRWTANGRMFDAVRAVDTATDPQWQGRGIFSRLTLALVHQMEDEGVPFVFNTPNSKSGPGNLKMGWSAVGRMAMWFRPLRPGRLIGAWLRRGHRDGYGESSDPVPSDSSSPEELLSHPGVADLVARSVGTDPRLVTALTPAYLQWRYSLIPGFGYNAGWVFRAGEGAAVVYRLKRRRSIRELCLCEVLAAPARESVRLGAELVRDLMHHTDADFASAIAAPGTPEQRVLLRAGFLPFPHSAPLLATRRLGLQPMEVDPLQKASWRLSTGTLELF